MSSRVALFIYVDVLPHARVIMLML